MSPALAIVRGETVPVVLLRALLARGADDSVTRFVVVRAGRRRVALAVDDVVGIRHLGDDVLRELPPLARQARPELIESVAALDGELLVVLRSGRVIPEEVWHELEAVAGGCS